MNALAINLRSNLKQLTKNMDDIAQKQIPFAMALTLTKTVQSAQRSEKIAMDRQLDRPTPFTKRGVAIQKATKTNWQAQVFIKDIQAEYLKWVVEGGTRKPKNKAHLLPVTLKRNKYGNIPRGKVQKLLQRADVFSGVVKGVAGIYQRTRRGTQLLLAFEPVVKYKPQYKFYEVAEKRIEQVIGRQFSLAMVRALKSAR